MASKNDLSMWDEYTLYVPYSAIGAIEKLLCLITTGARGFGIRSICPTNLHVTGKPAIVLRNITFTREGEENRTVSCIL